MNCPGYDATPGEPGFQGAFRARSFVTWRLHRQAVMVLVMSSKDFNQTQLKYAGPARHVALDVRIGYNAPGIVSPSKVSRPRRDEPGLKRSL